MNNSRVNDPEFEGHVDSPRKRPLADDSCTNEGCPSPKRANEPEIEDHMDSPKKRTMADYCCTDEANPSPKSEQQEQIYLNFIYDDGNPTPLPTSGKERIGDWIERNLLAILPRGTKTPDIDKCILLDSERSAVNLGWPTMMLDKNMTYKCKSDIVSDKVKMNTNLSRKDFGDLKGDSFRIDNFFIVKNPSYTVSKLFRYKKKIQFLKVHFLPDETIYDALSKDGRFNNEFLEKFVLLKEGKRDSDIFLPLKAKTFFGCVLSFFKKNTNQFALSESQLKIKTEPGLAERPDQPSISGVDQEDIVTGNSKVRSSSIVTKITSDKEFEDTIDNLLGLAVSERNNAKKKEKAANKLFASTYKKYALETKFQMYGAYHAFLAKVCHSVGAVIVKYKSGVEVFKGTCWRIGTKFVLTNNHVAQMVLDDDHILKEVIIDFDHGEDYDHRRFTTKSCVASSKDLDYAILVLEEKDNMEFPPSLTTMLGLPTFNKPLKEGRVLYFAGHPGGVQTTTNLCCPVQNPEHLKEEYVLTLGPGMKELLEDTNAETYHISTFFFGSSGSPAFLLEELMIIAMHTRGVCLDEAQGRWVEQGIRISAIMSDVKGRINAGMFKDLFGDEPPEDCPIPMEIN